MHLYIHGRAPEMVQEVDDEGAGVAGVALGEGAGPFETIDSPRGTKNGRRWDHQSMLGSWLELPCQASFQAPST